MRQGRPTPEQQEGLSSSRLKVSLLQRTKRGKLKVQTIKGRKKKKKKKKEKKKEKKKRKKKEKRKEKREERGIISLKTNTDAGEGLR